MHSTFFGIVAKAHSIPGDFGRNEGNNKARPRDVLRHSSGQMNLFLRDAFIPQNNPILIRSSALCIIDTSVYLRGRSDERNYLEQNIRGCRSQKVFWRTDLRDR